MLVVADGMGGHKAGEVASAIAVKVLRRELERPGAEPTGALRAAIEQSFEFRETKLPLAFPDPPAAWTEPYAAMARDNPLPWPTMDSALQAVRAFLDPVLRGDTLGVWAPETWSWR